jgi:hypothetical protein
MGLLCKAIRKAKFSNGGVLGTVGRPFLKGRSGNPRGRPLGARNAATVIAEQLLDGEAEVVDAEAYRVITHWSHDEVRHCRILIRRRFALTSATQNIPDLRSCPFSTPSSPNATSV